MIASAVVLERAATYTASETSRRVRAIAYASWRIATATNLA